MIKRYQAFTLIEVLLALAIIAIALTALLQAIGQNIVYTERIKNDTISHWVAMQGIEAIQLGLISVPANHELSQVTKMLGETWYWRAKLSPSPIPYVQQIEIRISRHATGPFEQPLIGYRRISS